MPRPKRLLYLLPIALYIVLSSLYLFVIPPGESPDEPSHLQCIEQVTQYNRIPIIDPRPRGSVWWARERIISGLVCAHMPLYYFLAGYTQQVVQSITQVPAHYEFPPNNPGWATGESPAMFTHQPKNTFFAIDEPASLTVLRIESMLLGMVSVLGAYWITRRIDPDLSYADLVAMTLVAGWPQFVFMSRAINNDSLAVALSVGVIAILVSVGRPGRYVVATLLSALAILSKFTMIFTAGVVTLAFVVEVAGSRNRRWYLWAGFASLGLYALLAAILLLQPTLRSHLEWTQTTMSGIQSDAGTLAYWADVLKATVESGWARFGWMNVLTPDVLAYAWWAAIIISVVIGVRMGLSRLKSREVRLAKLIGGIWLAAVLIAYIRINLNRFQPQFRYSFSMIPVLAAFAAVGLLTLLKHHERLQPAAAPLVTAVLFVANLWIIFAIVVPAYT